MYKINVKLKSGKRTTLKVYPSKDAVILDAPEFGKKKSIPRPLYEEGKALFIESLEVVENENSSSSPGSTVDGSGNKKRRRARKVKNPEREGDVDSLHPSPRGEDQPEES
jgi:hypothetical protein